MTSLATKTVNSRVVGRRTSYPRDATVHGLFEAQAARAPEAVAVVGNGKQLTYRELSHRSTELASVLRTRGVSSGSRVGLHSGRSGDAIVGMLAILKAGASYVPLDPADPKPRLQAMLEDARPSLVLTVKRLTDQFRDWPADVVSWTLPTVRTSSVRRVRARRPSRLQ